MSTGTPKPIDALRCPACGEPNACGFSAAEPCWCTNPELARLEPASAAMTCYCRKCLEQELAKQQPQAT